MALWISTKRPNPNSINEKEIRFQNPRSLSSAPGRRSACLCGNHGCLFALGKASGQSGPAAAYAARPAGAAARPYSDAWLAVNHGKYDNIWTPNMKLVCKIAQAPGDLLPGLLTPALWSRCAYEQRQSARSGANEFQIDVNPLDNLNAIGTSNDGQTAGVGIFAHRRRATWTSRDASFYGGCSRLLRPRRRLWQRWEVYAISSTPARRHLHPPLSDGGATWQGPSQVSTPTPNSP